MKRFLQRWPWLVALLILILVLFLVGSRVPIPHYDSDCPSGQVVVAGQCTAYPPTP